METVQLLLTGSQTSLLASLRKAGLASQTVTQHYIHIVSTRLVFTEIDPWVCVTVDGEKNTEKSKNVHLGNNVEQCSNEIQMKKIIDNFIRRANKVMSQFKLAPHSIKYKLFKSFCSSLYGFLLLNKSTKAINTF